MKTIQLILGYGLLLLASLQSSAFSDEVPTGKDSIDINYFLEQALVMGAAEIESGQLALKKSNLEEVKKFAQKIIDEHTNSNVGLIELARQKKINLPTGAGLVERARKFAFLHEKAGSFDKAYARHETKSLADTLALFNRAALSKDIDIAGFATAGIPKLKHQLQFAEQLSKAP